MTNHQKILLITEGKQDIDILRPILKAAQLPIERIRFIANLIREVMPSQMVLYKTLDGRQFTAEQILENVQEGTDIGKQYASDILRVARDFLKRQANRST